MSINMWQAARDYIANSSESSKIYIGCDSQIFVKNKNNQGTRFWADYSIVVIVHKDGCHGCKIFHNSMALPDYTAANKKIRPRLMSEVQMALEAFYAIEDVIDGRHLEVHLDVNPSPKFKSNEVTAEALGWVRGLGLDAKIKPEAFAASRAADQVVRRKGHFQN